MADIYQSIDGTGINRKQWQELKDTGDWTLKEYRNDKIWVRLHWIGKYDKSLPSEYRHSHGIQVYNRNISKRSEWEEENLIDKGWILDVAATETFRTRSAAESRYEDLLLTYTKSFIEVDDDGDAVLVEEGNEFAPAGPAGSSLLKDEEQIAAAAEAGIDLGGWS